MSSNMKLAKQLLSLKYAKSNIVFSSQAVVPRRRGGKEQRWQAYCAPAQMLKLVSERFNLLLPSFSSRSPSFLVTFSFFDKKLSGIVIRIFHICSYVLYLLSLITLFIITIGLKSSSIIIEQHENLKNPKLWAKNFGGKWRIFQTITFLVGM